MISLTREQHCALAKVDVQAFKTLQRYHRVPVLPEHLRAPKGFSPFETLALMTAVSFRERFFLSHAQAAHLGSQLEVIFPHWSAIVDAGNSRPMNEILFGKLYFAIDVTPPMITVCGPPSEFGIESPAPMGIIALSISRIVTVMRVRADDLGIDLSEFWYPPAKLPTPQLDPSHGWDKAIANVNAELGISKDAATHTSKPASQRKRRKP
ncbi:hypothetical protein H8A99_13400 [Bradyrhizobium sp. Arg68]|uniref:hypothetical protein n=1 Tax=Bradyrhizobium ivorense TaxID=2511166 RepID=UPI001E43D7AA|nr:hypothetical protein [Bradyrhizobium ivorense]MCC8937441.1 hypothetical protein [Bradyrhizobium ivorense]